MKKTTIQVDVDVRDKLREIATRNKMTIGNVLRKMLENFMGFSDNEQDYDEEILIGSK